MHSVSDQNEWTRVLLVRLSLENKFTVIAKSHQLRKSRITSTMFASASVSFIVLLTIFNGKYKVVASSRCLWWSKIFETNETCRIEYEAFFDSLKKLPNNRFVCRRNGTDRDHGVNDSWRQMNQSINCCRLFLIVIIIIAMQSPRRISCDVEVRYWFYSAISCAYKSMGLVVVL